MKIQFLIFEVTEYEKKLLKICSTFQGARQSIKKHNGVFRKNMEIHKSINGIVIGRADRQSRFADGVYERVQ